MPGCYVRVSLLSVSVTEKQKKEKKKNLPKAVSLREVVCQLIVLTLQPETALVRSHLPKPHIPKLETGV